MTPRRANQPQLSREQIVSAALKLVDEHGLEKHSMRQLGAELGVDPTSVYHYVPSKSDLYDLLIDAVVNEFDFGAIDTSVTPPEQLVLAAHEMKRALLIHPRLMPLIATRSMRTPAQLGGVEALLAIFARAGFSDAEAVSALDVLGTHVFGAISAWAAHLTDAEYHRDDRPRETDVASLPNVARVFADESNYLGFETEFDVGVRALVAGLFSLHERGELAKRVGR
jgi:AcrR family transcriptional regulator